MDQQTDTDHDQADEDILTYTVSDEALEATAGTERGPVIGPTSFTYVICSPAGSC
jgi:hypothetical protein